MRKREQRNSLNGLLVLIAVCVLFFYMFAYQVTNQALFVPQQPSYEVGETFFQIDAEDGTKLAVYWGESPGAKDTVFYFHGNAEDLGDIEFILSNYRLQGVNVLSFDYRGYGRSEGKATEKTCYADAESVLAYAVENLGVDAQRVIYHGRSLGGGVAMEMAKRQPAKALVLESTFLSAYRVYLPLKWLPGDKFVNASKAKKVKCPVLVIHGREDTVVPFEQGVELAGLFVGNRVEKLWVDEVGHNDLLLVANARYWAALRGFLGSLH